MELLKKKVGSFYPISIGRFSMWLCAADRLYFLIFKA